MPLFNKRIILEKVNFLTENESYVGDNIGLSRIKS